MQTSAVPPARSVSSSPASREPSMNSFQTAPEALAEQLRGLASRFQHDPVTVEHATQASAVAAQAVAIAGTEEKAENVDTEDAAINAFKVDEPTN